MKVLGDRTIDNTMAGAKAKLNAFTDYKEKDKGVIVNDFLSIEGQYNQLAMRLSDHKRPQFVAGEVEKFNYPRLRRYCRGWIWLVCGPVLLSSRSASRSARSL